MDDIIINEKKVVRSIISGIAFLIVCIYILTVGIIEGNLFLIIIGGISTVLLSAALIFIIKNALGSIPMLIIDKNGITDISTLFSVGFIGWQEIKSINVRKRSRKEYIIITVYDLSKLMKRISPAKRLAIKLNLILKYFPIEISALLLSTADIEFNELASLLQKGLEEYKTNQ
ncbi:hypothetical protein J1C67_09370 [Clostridium gasigenes]|uniref:STM3941 family protein n=1 Tax=Clostridium gasigenes TaxID=94869 RepID=UPI0014386522|nr:STM3941 family protein [Clostridium gasigenes]MBU3134052.1 hypothetical protein [Clostridium gasigenes]NKF08465.1 hypothetical protein [Clostridium gasigenes]QSW21280.1 hypothetical protein J1C67_09370 [Clostridium gasigenes]